MTTKEDFTADEWVQIEAAPVYAGMSIITADPAITSIFKETAALAKAMLQNPVPESAQDLVGGIVADMQARAANKDKMETPEFQSKDPAEIAKEIDAQISGAAAIVDAKATPAEATGYKEWIMDVAQSVAEAGREGGFLGIGSVRVSEQEQEALNKLRQTLGLS